MAVINLLMACGVCAQTSVNIWPGKAPGSEHWTWQEQNFANTPMGTIVENVVSPTLTVYLPAPGKATGTGIIIAPGGACIALVMTGKAGMRHVGCSKEGLRSLCSNIACSGKPRKASPGT
ncbi:MAG: hypothetical protein ACRER9_00175 [Gammaproteobacteria bacterium]